MTDPEQAIRTLCPHLTGEDLARVVQGVRDEMAAAARLHAWLAARATPPKA